jgi:hypothetical protein
MVPWPGADRTSSLLARASITTAGPRNAGNPGLEEDLIMGEREQAPGSGPGEQPGPDPELLDEARETAMMREIVRRQERHHEGGVEPELEERDEEAGPDA